MNFYLNLINFIIENFVSNDKCLLSQDYYRYEFYLIPNSAQSKWQTFKNYFIKTLRNFSCIT